MKLVFQFDHVTKRFGDQVALDQFTLGGEPGSVIALLGENGAGKTTAIRILLGLLEPDSGEAYVHGLQSRHLGQEIRRRVGYVPDRPVLYDWMTVAEAGWFIAGFYDATFIGHYRDLVTQYELPLDKKIKTLSKGMRAKVSLALAMAHRPELLVLDEPTSGLDPLVRRQFLESMVDVAAEGRTVLISSHQIAEVERIADTVAILKKGKLQLVAKLEDLKKEVHELTVSLTDDSHPLPEIPGTILSRVKIERQWRLLVRDVDPVWLNRCQTDDSLPGVEVRTPSLEEFFLGFMRNGEEEGMGEKTNSRDKKVSP
ncbi:MAG: ABC transporter ATP-binding protein [Planctomycetaceae bacterium]